MKLLPNIKELIFCYDVGCQWSKKFDERLQKGAPYLAWPPGLDITTAVGSFHLGAHIDDCYALFSTNFIKGAAQIDGENLESLWNTVNPAAPSMRGMTTSYCRETLDWLMYQSNWQKVLLIGAFPTNIYVLESEYDSQETRSVPSGNVLVTVLAP